MIGVRYTSTAEGEAPKLVTCKGCGYGYGYGYWMTRRGSLSNTSWFLVAADSARDRSGREAEGEVAKRLRAEHDPVPCPQCGRYQKTMIEPDRKSSSAGCCGGGSDSASWAGPGSSPSGWC